MCMSPLYRCTTSILHLGEGGVPPSLLSKVLKKGYAVIGWRDYLDCKNRYLMPSNFFTMLPCGKCTECRVKKVKEWSARCIAEKEYSSDSYFVTLTYADENLHYADLFGYNVPILCKDDVQKFFKRLRKALYGNKGGQFRYFLSGEYGEKTLRPHYHFIGFNLPLNDLKFYKVVKKTIYYTSDFLSKVWGLGHVVVGKVNYKTTAYTCSYTLKKVGFLTSPNTALQSVKDLLPLGLSYDLLKACIAAELLPRPFALMSRRESLGRKYYRDHKEDILNGLPDFNLSKISYFDNLLKKDDLLAFYDLKDVRSSIAEGSRIATESRLIVPEELRYMLAEEENEKAEKSKTML